MKMVPLPAWWGRLCGYCLASGFRLGLVVTGTSRHGSVSLSRPYR
jgi:hypothetical protein